jgi:hypothetical protein
MDEMTESSNLENHPESSKETRKPKHKQDRAILHTHNIRHSQWTYFHLVLFSLSSNMHPHDILTAKQRLNTALARFLGVLGSTVQADILHLDGKDLWVRVPKDSGNAFQEAISSWSEAETQSKYIIKGREDWLVKLMPDSPQDLF